MGVSAIPQWGRLFGPTHSHRFNRFAVEFGSGTGLRGAQGRHVLLGKVLAWVGGSPSGRRQTASDRRRTDAWIHLFICGDPRNKSAAAHHEPPAATPLLDRSGAGGVVTARYQVTRL